MSVKNKDDDRLLNEIERIRKELENMIKKEKNLTDSNIIKLSQKLDGLLNRLINRNSSHKTY